MTKEIYFTDDTIAAVATPSGEGAIGVVRLSGSGAVTIASPLITLRQSQPLSDLPPQKIAFAVFHQNGTCIDRVLVTVFRAPNSYTGEDVVEVSCHGSPVILKQILNLFVQNGARLAEPGEFSQRAFLNAKLDLAQAEAVADLIHAQTEISRSVAFAQLEGKLSKECLGIRDSLTEIAVHLEVKIDHSDDPAAEITISSEEIKKRLEEAVRKIQNLAASYEFGKIARDGVKIAIVGKPNVGKSSLLNQLLRSDRAIVTAQPGTTRDTIEESFDLLGIPAVLVDTAGIRQRPSDLAEQIGMDRTKRSVEKADLVIIVLDSSVELSEEDREVAQWVAGKNKAVVAVNKIDLPNKMNLAGIFGQLGKFPAVSISALENLGIEKLARELYDQAVPSGDVYKNAKRTNDVIVSSLRHYQCLVRCGKSLENALKLCEENGGEECLSAEIRDAVDALGEMVGEVVTEDILKEIFSKFCIGK